jgi:hypothetical protein
MGARNVDGAQGLAGRFRYREEEKMKPAKIFRFPTAFQI